MDYRYKLLLRFASTQITFITLLFTAVLAWAEPQPYFVDGVNGNDSWSGKRMEPNAEGDDGPWQTADKVFEFSLGTSPTAGFEPGDSISFKRGQEFVARTGNGDTTDNEGNYLPVFGSSGDVNLPIVIGAYGEGARPILRVRVSKVEQSQWIEYNNVWVKEGSSYNTGWTLRTDYLWENDIPLKAASSLDCLQGNGPGCPDGNWYHDFKAIGTPWAPLYYRPTSGSPGDNVYYGRFGEYIFNGLHHITIRDISFRTNARPVRFWADNGPVHDIIIENNEFYATEFGVEFVTDNYDITNIKFNSNVSDYVVRPVSMVSENTIYSFYDSEIAYNDVRNCNAFDYWGGDQQTIYLQHVNNSQIHHNIISGGQCAGIAGWYDGSAGRTFQGNTIAYNFINNLQGTGQYEARRVAYGIGLGGGPVADVCHSNDILYNVIANSDQGVIVANCHVVSQPKNQVYNNTVYGNGINLLVRAGADDWIFKNNIFSTPQPTVFEPIPAHIIHERSYVLGAGVELDNNLYYPGNGTLFGIDTCRNETGGNQCLRDERDPLAFTDYDGWVGTTEQDQQSSPGDPLFADVVNANFRLSAGSPAINTGDDLGLTIDNDDNLVPIATGPDKGAYEFQDSDGDGIEGALDNCPDDANPNQTDSDSDGIGNVCDTEQIVLTSISTHDGWVRESSENSNIGGSNSSSGSGSRPIRFGDNATNRQFKAIVSFNTSLIPAGSSVLGAQLELTRGSFKGNDEPYSTFGAAHVDLSVGGFGGDHALANSDFEATPDVEQVGQVSDDGALGTAILNSAGYMAIEGAAIIQLRIAFEIDDNNDESADFAGYYSGDNTNAGRHPRLVVDYTLAD